ncbi:MAG TPA: hypothetical protein V6C52_03365 [Coleofasciculaceae cyanobacterium]|jgi:hypothetical protein
MGIGFQPFNFSHRPQGSRKSLAPTAQKAPAPQARQGHLHGAGNPFLGNGTAALNKSFQPPESSPNGTQLGIYSGVSRQARLEEAALTGDVSESMFEAERPTRTRRPHSAAYSNPSASTGFNMLA